MSLHFRGIQVPALGSPRDIAYRKYLAHEVKVEAKKHQMLFLTAIGSPAISDDQRRAWDKQARTVFEEYIALMLGEQITETAKEEKELLEFYQQRIKNTKPSLTKDKETGNLVVSNLPEL